MNSLDRHRVVSWIVEVRGKLSFHDQSGGGEEQLQPPWGWGQVMASGAGGSEAVISRRSR